MSESESESESEEAAHRDDFCIVYPGFRFNICEHVLS